MSDVAGVEKRFERFPTDEWVAASSRGMVVFLICSVTVIPWMFYGISVEQGSPVAGSASAAFGWAMERYIALSKDLAWLLPLLFGSVVALGFWNGFGGVLNRNDRRDLNVRTAGPVAVASFCLQLCVFAVAARVNDRDAGIGLTSLFVATVVVVATSIEVGRVFARIPLTEQLVNATQQAKRVERQFRGWRGSSVDGSPTRTSIVANAAALVVLMSLAATLAAAQGNLAQLYFLGSVVFGGLVSGWVSGWRVQTVTGESRGARLGGVLGNGFVCTMWAFATVFILLMTAIRFLLGVPAEGVATLLGYVLVSVSALWTGRRDGPVPPTLGGLIRLRCSWSLLRQFGSQLRRARDLRTEIARRAAESAPATPPHSPPTQPRTTPTPQP